MTYSVRNIVIALALAVAAAAAVLLYTSSYKDQVTRDQERVQVMVASQDIPAGTPGDQATGMMAVKEVLRTDVTPGSLTTSGGLEGKVASQTVFAGQQVVASVFQTPTTQAASLSLDKTERGVRVNVDFTSGALGAIKAGDHVDVFTTFKTTAAGLQDNLFFSRRLMTDVRVLEAPEQDPAAGPGKLSEQDKATKHQTLMLAVSQADATKLAFIQGVETSQQGTTVLWVAVRPPDGQAEEMAPTIENVQSMLADGVPVTELKEKYGTYIDDRIKAQIAADALRSQAGSGVLPTDTTSTTTSGAPK
jgi:Flp pilus assembly protein CpaB